MIKIALVVFAMTQAGFTHGNHDANSLSALESVAALQTPEELAAQTFVALHYGVNASDRFAINDFQRLLNNPNFDANKITAIYAHGYEGYESSPRNQAVIQAYQNRRRSHNCLTLEWFGPSKTGGIYKIAVYNAVMVGEIVANVFWKLLSDGNLSTEQLRKFHLIGHSMGAQLFGVTGRKLIQISGNAFRLNRITGLDPSNMGFPPMYSHHLSEKDAEFVDIIHTSIGIRASATTGTADFYPNGGVATQPGCPFVALNGNELCGHQRSVYYWAESVTSEERSTFFAAAPRTWFDDTDKGTLVNMGIDCPTTARGKYFLQTNSQAPYSLGESGIHYDASIWNVTDPNKC